MEYFLESIIDILMICGMILDKAHLSFWENIGDNIFFFFFTTFGWIPFFEVYLFVIICGVVLYWLTRIILGSQSKSKGFYEHQKIAKRKVAWLNTLLIFLPFLVFLTSFGLFYDVIGLTHSIQHSTRVYDTHSPNMLAFIAALSFILLGVIVVSYIVKSILMNRHGIDNLAKRLDAKEITEEQTLNDKQKMLLNIVEEMAIASSMKMPRVLVIENEYGINAMCSGERFGKASEQIAIFVTQGALEAFTREELQGVIGHEFSHAFHQDVALNLKIFSLVFALTCLVEIGIAIMRSSSRSKNNKNGGAVILIALVFFVLGAISSTLASIIQAAISRQKEFLADASSVQYTRNPNAIKSALNKLLEIQKNSEIATSLDDYKKTQVGALSNPQAKACSHMFFLSGFKSVFATHPSLEERIQSLNKMS